MRNAMPLSRERRLVGQEQEMLIPNLVSPRRSHRIINHIVIHFTIRASRVLVDVSRDKKVVMTQKGNDYASSGHVLTKRPYHERRVGDCLGKRAKYWTVSHLTVRSPSIGGRTGCIIHHQMISAAPVSWHGMTWHGMAGHGTETA